MTGRKGRRRSGATPRAEQDPKTAAGGVSPPPARPDWFAQLPLRVPALVGMCYCAGCVTGPSAADAKVAISRPPVTRLRGPVECPLLALLRSTRTIRGHPCQCVHLRL